MRVNSLESGSCLDKGTGGDCPEGGCLRGGEVWGCGMDTGGRSGLSLVLVLLANSEKDIEDEEMSRRTWLVYA